MVRNPKLKSWDEPNSGRNRAEHLKVSKVFLHRKSVRFNPVVAAECGSNNVIVHVSTNCRYGNSAIRASTLFEDSC